MFEWRAEEEEGADDQTEVLPEAYHGFLGLGGPEPTPLTDAEYNRLKKIEGDRSSRAWLNAVDAIRSSRQGKYPSDWHEALDRLEDDLIKDLRGASRCCAPT